MYGVEHGICCSFSIDAVVDTVRNTLFDTVIYCYCPGLRCDRVHFMRPPLLPAGSPLLERTFLVWRQFYPEERKDHFEDARDGWSTGTSGRNPRCGYSGYPLDLFFVAVDTLLMGTLEYPVILAVGTPGIWSTNF